MNRFLFIAIFLWVANFSAMAQAYKVSGHVYLHGEPLPFASVKNAHTGEVALSDSVGCYEIEASANDSLVCEYLGCASKTMPVAGRKRLDFQLEEESTNLNGVEVVARRRPVRMSHNGFVVNMDAVRKDGKLLSDVLPQLPTLRLKDNVLSMAGKSGVLVYLNNHQVYLSDGDLMAYLNSLGLENIKRIHVISTPPAKYEAEENVGILEIETTKNIHPGWQARLLGKASVAHYLTGGASANILYSGKNFTIGNTLLGSLGNAYTRSRYTNDFGDYLVATDCPKKSTEKVVMTLTTFSLDISDRDHLSATLQLPWLHHGRDYDLANDTRYFSLGSMAVDSIMSSKGQGRSANYQASGEINYAHVFGEQSDLNITLGYINSYVRNRRDWHSQTTAETTTLDEDFYSAGHQKYDIYTLKADFTHALKGWKLNEGYKLAYTHSTSYNEENEQLVADATPQDLFGYREWNHALYVNAETSLRPLSLSLGLRAEYTQTKGISYSLGTTNRNHYWRLFPVVDVVYSINESNTLSLSYAGRIRRPSYWLLDPFRWYTSKYDYSEGNPFLKPTYIHDLSLSYMHGNALYAKLYFSKTDKDFGRMVFLDGENIQNQVERTGNFLDIAEWGADLEYSPLLCSWLETKLSGELFYASYASHQAAFRNVKGWGCVLSWDSTVFLGKHFSASLYVEDDLPGYYNYRKCHNALLLNAGLSYTNSKKNLMVSVKAEDLLKNGSPKYTYYSNGVKQSFDNYYDSRRVEVSLVLKLGNSYNKAKTNFQSSNAEEKERL